jgi:hypothetical protein
MKSLGATIMALCLAALLSSPMLLLLAGMAYAAMVNSLLLLLGCFVGLLAIVWFALRSTGPDNFGI